MKKKYTEAAYKNDRSMCFYVIMRNDTLGARLRDIREIRDISTTSVCITTGIESNRLAAIENDDAEMTVSELIKLADLYNISIDTVARPDFGLPLSCVLRELYSRKCVCKNTF